MWRRIRIFVLLFILLAVALDSWRAKRGAQEWKAPIAAVVYPINADGDSTTEAYLASIQNEVFAPIEEFMKKEAARYGVYAAWGAPIQVRVAAPVRSQPPAPPTNGSALQVAWWSLKLRYWAWRNDTYTGPAPQVRMFVRYHDPRTHQVLAHSVGLEKGMLGIVNAFASRRMAGSNNVVLAHELLHTVGATDKYDLANGLPRFPDGYAEPQRDPLHPQEKAELMGGRIALDETRASIPDGLHQVVIGPLTAREINWIKQ